MRKSPTREVLDKCVTDILYCYGQIFADYCWRVVVKPKLISHKDEITEGCAQIVQNACIESVLVFYRKIDEFYKPRLGKSNAKDDDLRAYDFPGFNLPNGIIDENSRTELHKRVAHITTREATDGKFAWNTMSASPNFVQHGRPFFNYLVNEFYSTDQEKRDLTKSMIDKINRISNEVSQQPEILKAKEKN